MNVDCYYTIGKQHTVCQDYAATDDTGFLPDDPKRIFLADGCSSSPHTDVGARLLVWAAMNNTEPLKAIWEASGNAAAVGLPRHALDVTLLIGEVSVDGVETLVYGDGVIAARHRESRLIDIFVVECPAGAPDYLSYHLDPERMAQYQSLFPGLMKKIRTFAGEEEFLPEGVPSFIPVKHHFPASEYDVVALFSDGIASFQRRRGTSFASVPIPEAVAQVMAIKNPNGEFVTRRIRNGFLGRFCVENEWHHYDDFAMAAVYQDKP